MDVLSLLVPWVSLWLWKLLGHGTSLILVSFSRSGSWSDPDFYGEFPFGGDVCNLTSCLLLFSGELVFRIVSILEYLLKLPIWDVSTDASKVAARRPLEVVGEFLLRWSPVFQLQFRNEDMAFSVHRLGRNLDARSCIIQCVLLLLNLVLSCRFLNFGRRYVCGSGSKIATLCRLVFLARLTRWVDSCGLFVGSVFVVGVWVNFPSSTVVVFLIVCGAFSVFLYRFNRSIDFCSVLVFFASVARTFWSFSGSNSVMLDQFVYLQLSRSF